VIISYPPTYINGQFTKFFRTYADSNVACSTVVLDIDDENLFSQMRAQLLVRSTAIQTQITVETVRSEKKTNPTVAVAREEERTAMKPNNVKNSKNEQVTNRLILHYTHEKRVESYKRDIHQIWSEVFANTLASEVQVIVGNRNNRDAKSEMVQKRPNLSLLITKDYPGKYQSLSSSHFHAFYLDK
jgi:ATP-dependent Lon protease